MGAKYQRTEGICLRRVDYSNTSQVATFLTPDRGRLSFMAKGVKRAPKKGIKTSFDLLCRYELVFTEPLYGSLYNLTKRQLTDDFRDIRRSLRAIICAYYAAELMLNFTMEEEPCRELYSVLIQVLRMFGSGENLALGALLLEIEVLRHHGSLPVFGICAECESSVAGQDQVFFSPARGGALCPRCRETEQAGMRGIPAQTAHLALLDRLSEHRPSRPDRVSIDLGQVRSMSRLSRHMIQFVLGKQLRMWDYRLFEGPESLRKAGRH